MTGLDFSGPRSIRSLGGQYNCFRWLTDVKASRTSTGAVLSLHVQVNSSVWLSWTGSIILGGRDCLFLKKLVYQAKYFPGLGSVRRRPVMRGTNCCSVTVWFFTCNIDLN